MEGFSFRLSVRGASLVLLPWQMHTYEVALYQIGHSSPYYCLFNDSRSSPVLLLQIFVAHFGISWTASWVCCSTSMENTTGRGSYQSHQEMSPACLTRRLKVFVKQVLYY